MIKMDKLAKRAGIAGGIIIALILTKVLFTTSVPSGMSGVKTRFGAVMPYNLNSGLNFKVPLMDSIVLIDNRTQRIDVKGNAASKDLQTITYEIALNFKVKPTESANIYKQVGEKYSDIVVIPAMQETIKNIVAKYTAEESIINRSTVSDDMVKDLAEKLKDYGLAIDSISIVDFDFSDEFNKAIESKQTAQQDALKQIEENKKKQAQNDQKIKDANATAEANRIVTESITPQLIEQQKIEKWDGKLPTVQGSSNTMLDVSGITGK